MQPEHKSYHNYSGIKLNRTIVVDVKNDKSMTSKKLQYLRGVMNRRYLEFDKYDDDGSIKYITFVSKTFYADTPNAINHATYKYNLIRNDLGFYPQFHYVEKMHGNSVDCYTVSQYEAVCCAAEIDHGDATEEFRYGHMITESEWTFTDSLYGTPISYPASSLQPFIADTSQLEGGYYDIKFRYSLTNGTTNECNRISAFRIKILK
jgi:hypothetical protein